jgi:carbonic anhydrase/acetyltransferase-like protein (isoleucine patch superfamily)
VELAAVVVVPGQKDIGFEEPHPFVFSSKTSPAVHSSLLPVLGNDVLRMWMERIHKLGLPSLWVTSDAHNDTEIRSSLIGFAKQGIERLLMIKLKSYAEMDLCDLLQFHCQKQNSVTEAHDSRGKLGVCVFDHAALQASDASKIDRAIHVSERMSYTFRGYAKRILSATERQELVKDALTGGCAMRPLGKEIQDQVWVGEGVTLADSVKVIGPTYIGDRTVIRAGATIGPFASVERDCLVDCGTTIERSTILPGTYLSSGILIRHALVDGSYLEDLRCGAIADLLPSGLAGSMQPSNRAARTSTDSDAELFLRFGDVVSDTAQGSPEWREMRL